MKDPEAVAQPLALELRGIVKRFAAVTAVDHVNFAVRSGTVHALLGENGAGKSTLMRIAFGLESADAGSVRVIGQAERTARHGHGPRGSVGMVHQHLSLVGSLTAAENLVLGQRGLYAPARARALLSRVSADAGLAIAPDALARDLSIVEQQRLEILKAVAFDARLLILDEPTAVLAPAEIADLFAWIRRFAASGGSVVFVTHKVREALAIADDVTVLRGGRVVLLSAAHAQTEAALARAIFPDAIDSSVASASAITPATRAVVVEANDVTLTDTKGVQRIRSASFVVRAGDVLGVAAVDGSGHRELLLAIAGLAAPAAGTLLSPANVALIPADRARDAVVSDFTLTENVALHGLGERRGLMPWQELRHTTARLITSFAIVAPSADTKLGALSGGNQQRLVVARELDENADLVVADNPTRGLDIQATAFVHQRLRAAARRGAAVVVHSSDLDEVLTLATRIIVVFHGMVREHPLDREVVGRAMLGAA